MEERNKPIGVFDSGMGGISVLRELVKEMPEEDFLYFGDSKNAPYGTRELEEVRKLTIGNIEGLIAKGAKAIVMACNTATSAAVADLRKMYPSLPLVGIEPAIKPAVTQNPGGRILVMATPMTLHQKKFQKLLSCYKDMAEVIPLPCPGLMEFVERGDLDGEDLRKYLTELFWGLGEKPIDGIVLGCTHYPFALKMIQNVVGKEITIYDGGRGTAREMKRRLQVAGLTTNRTQKGTVVFTNSRNEAEEIALCEKLFYLDS